MGKMKVYEVAKELEMNNKEFIAKLKEMGIEVKSHLNVLDEADIKKIYERLKPSPDSTKNGEEKVQKKTADAKAAKKDVKKDQPRIIRREIVQVRDEENKVEEKKENSYNDYELKPKHAANPEQFRRSDAQIVKKKAPIPSINDLFRPKKEVPPEPPKAPEKEKPVEPQPVIAPKTEPAKEQKPFDRKENPNNNKVNPNVNNKFNYA